jgi:NADH-quinone oxidoreductase subunit N
MVLDTFSLYLAIFGITVALLASIAAAGVVDAWDGGEAFYAVVGLIALGTVVLSVAKSLYTVYVAWILAAVSSYIIISLSKDRFSAEAATKYAVTGSVATILLLLVITLVHATMGRPAIEAIIAYGEPVLLALVVGLAVASIGFKMGVVPFHGWLVDAYGNARPLAVAVASASAKIIAVLLIARIVAPYATASPVAVLYVVGVLAAVTMVVGNVGALITVRDSPQKLMAYSSIAQAGYIVAGVAALAALPGADNRAAIAGIALNTAAYALSKFAGFVALDASCKPGECSWKRLRGLLYANPALGLAFVFAMASLAGAPPLLGFWGKLYLLLAVASVSKVLAAFMAGNIIIASFYYGYAIYAVLQKREEGIAKLEVTRGKEIAALIAGLLLVIVVFIYFPWNAYALHLFSYTPLP